MKCITYFLFHFSSFFIFVHILGDTIQFMQGNYVLKKAAEEKLLWNCILNVWYEISSHRSMLNFTLLSLANVRINSICTFSNLLHEIVQQRCRLLCPICSLMLHYWLHIQPDTVSWRNLLRFFHLSILFSFSLEIWNWDLNPPLKTLLVTA